MLMYSKPSNFILGIEILSAAEPATSKAEGNCNQKQKLLLKKEESSHGSAKKDITFSAQGARLFC